MTYATVKTVRARALICGRQEWWQRREKSPPRKLIKFACIQVVATKDCKHSNHHQESRRYIQIVINLLS